MLINEAIEVLTNEAIRRGAEASDDNGIVRALVEEEHGLGFYAWFVICCAIADRNAQAEGYKDQGDRAAARMVRR